MPATTGNTLAPGKDSTAIIEYKMVTKLRLMELEQPATLYLTPTRSLFTYSQGKEGLYNQQTLRTGVMDEMQDGWYQDKTGSIVFKDFNSNQLALRSFVLIHIPYITEEPAIPEINWELKDSLKTIGNYTCKLANGYFRGRNYQAWFTSEIPFSNGPWKFQGLPGLILEVTDSKKEVGFYATSIKFPASFDVGILKAPIDGKKVNWETYKKAEDYEFDQVRQKFEASNTDRNSTATMTRNSNNQIEFFDKP